jgi:MFS family permease
MSDTTTSTTAGTTPRATDRMPPVDVRVRLSALWATTMFVIVFVDLFSLYREDVRANIESGTMFVFEIGQGFLIGVTLYVIIPSLMIFLSLVLPRRANRVTNIVLAIVYAITVVGGAIGEWGYYVMGSAVELVLLAIVVRLAVTWRVPVTTSRQAVSNSMR